jgi:type I restriction-modification system DNA methylase subunit
MNRSQARAFVSDTFTHGFDKASFRAFVQNLLNHFDESKAAQWNQQYVKDAFKDHVQKFERLGTYTSPNRETLDVLIVHLTTDSKLERARTSIRNFVADHLKQRDEKDAALVAFVSPSESSWRFSYIRMEYATVQAESGKVGVEARLTPARRFSYIVGEGESCHTAQSRFLNLLGNDSTDPALAQIEEAFSVEAVTKEFFEKYAELFGDIHAALENLGAKNKAIRDEFASKGIQTVDFAKKLMGQIVFLYFLQKKGWLGVERGKAWGTGPHDLLRKMASGAYGEYKNFFNDILEPLFYDTLASDRGHEAWCDRFRCRIPFLNGGLFEPLGDYDWRSIDISLPNELFTNAKHIEEGVTGSGVLDVFDRYNFTVNEAEPLEQEVAIDPEMLGKVFENLIEDNRRKGLGAFYTPREIVHYMCQQSLISYLDHSINRDRPTIERDEIVTFILHGEQFSFYEAAKIQGTIGKHYPAPPKSIAQHARLLDEALANITICDPAVGSGAFPVGMMTEIVKSRSALTPYFNDPHERTPYSFKRHAIQSCLYGVDIDAGAVEIAKLRLWLSLVVDEEETKQIKPLPNLDFKIVAGNSLVGFPFKSKGLHEVESLKAKFFEETNHERKAKLKAGIEQALRNCFAGSKQSLGYAVDFDFAINFSEVFHDNGGFGAVIANPPYIDSENMSKTNPELRKIIQSSYSMTKGNWDIYIAFYEKAFSLLGNNGVLSFITPDKWISKPFGDELRANTTDNILSLLNAGRDIFQSANVDAIVTVYTKRTQANLYIYEYCGTEIVPKRVASKVSMKPPYTYDWLFSDYVDVLGALEVLLHRLSEYAQCENACATSDAYKLKELLKEASANQNYERVFSIVNTGTIGKYLSRWGQRDMVYLGERYACPVVDKAAFRAMFPNTYGAKPTKKKLIIKGLNLLDACLDLQGGIIPGKTTLMIPSEDLRTLKFLAAILNSSVAFFYIKEKHIASSYNGGTTFTKEMINSLPIPEVSSADRDILVRAVDRLLKAKEHDREGEAVAIEQEIDRQVFSLYGLKEEDIQTVENAVHRKGGKSSSQTIEEVEA